MHIRLSVRTLYVSAIKLSLIHIYNNTKLQPSFILPLGIIEERNPYFIQPPCLPPIVYRSTASLFTPGDCIEQQHQRDLANTDPNQAVFCCPVSTPPNCLLMKSGRCRVYRTLSLVQSIVIFSLP